MSAGLLNTLSLPLLGILITTPLGIAAGQILFKMSGEKLARSDAPIYHLAFYPVFILSLIIYGLATLVWIYALKSVPLLYAYSFMALSFVFVPILAYLFLGEAFTLRYFLGTLMIIAGLLIIQS